MQIKDLNGLKTWLDRYYQFLMTYLNTVSEATTVEDRVSAISSIIELFPNSTANLTLTDLVNNN